MKAASMLGVFWLAKACVLAGRSLPVSPWTAIAYLWQDVLVALLFAGLDIWKALARSDAHRKLADRCGWTLYGVAAIYTAINVAVAQALSTPLTWPLLRAAGGPLWDSIVSYATLGNTLRIALVLAGAAAFPFLLRRLSGRKLAVAGALVLPPFLVLGPIAVGRVETLGLHRNVLAVLVTTAFPRLGSAGAAAEWRASPMPSTADEPVPLGLERLRGAAAGRNVVCVVLESTAAQYLRMHGAAEDPMPNLTRLAREALLFENAYTVYPESIKGLFSVLCSTYPAVDTTPKDYESIRTPAIAEVLGRAGYRTGLFHSGRFGYLGMESIVRNRGFQTLEDAGDIGGEQESSFGLDDERLAVRRVLGWIDERPRGERFFAIYQPVAGHHPYATPEPGPFPEEQVIDRYRNALHHADAALGELWQGLVHRGLDRSTLLVVWGDHGEAFGQHAGNYAHTLFIYEENVRVPLLIAAPGLALPTSSSGSATRVPETASLIDVAPTILDLLGLPAPAAYQGGSLLNERRRLALFFTDYSLGLLGLRDGRWKFIHELDSNRSKLFDLAVDPAEQVDLASSQPERTSAYRAHLLNWAKAQRHRIK